MMDRLLPEEVRMARIEAGYSLREASEKSGLTGETISDIERGLRVPHPSSLRKLADAYAVAISRFILPREEALPKVRAPSDASEVSEEQVRRAQEVLEQALAMGLEEDSAQAQQRLLRVIVARLGRKLWGWDDVVPEQIGRPERREEEEEEEEFTDEQLEDRFLEIEELLDELMEVVERSYMDEEGLWLEKIRMGLREVFLSVMVPGHDVEHREEEDCMASLKGFATDLDEIAALAREGEDVTQRLDSLRSSMEQVLGRTYRS